MEIKWEKIEGFDYIVSSHGEVKNVKTGKTLKPYSNGNGYLKVTLCKEGKKSRLYVHRLVGKAFVDGYHESLTIDHLDGCRTNNNYSNLEWVTLETNIERMHKAHGHNLAG